MRLRFILENFVLFFISLIHRKKGPRTNTKKGATEKNPNTGSSQMPKNLFSFFWVVKKNGEGGEVCECSFEKVVKKIRFLSTLTHFSHITVPNFCSKKKSTFPSLHLSLSPPSNHPFTLPPFHPLHPQVIIYPFLHIFSPLFFLSFFFHCPSGFGVGEI